MEAIVVVVGRYTEPTMAMPTVDDPLREAATVRTRSVAVAVTATPWMLVVSGVTTPRIMVKNFLKNMSWAASLLGFSAGGITGSLLVGLTKDAVKVPVRTLLGPFVPRASTMASASMKACVVLEMIGMATEPESEKPAPALPARVPSTTYRLLSS